MYRVGLFLAALLCGCVTALTPDVSVAASPPRLPSLADAEEVLVHAPAGTIAGASLKGVDHFLGVPFALPPTPPRRFMAPQPPARWEGTLEAKHFKDPCVQEPWSRIDGGSEDCLYLNVIRPSNVTASQRVPVMVWIHGGSYSMGGTKGYPADWILKNSDTPVIVVTVAYRLAALGFMALPGLEEHFNAALLDQQAGMRWVHENIAAFGGDASRVTIFGESAGGGSVSLHMAMESSWPYFQGAIIESAGFRAESAESVFPESLKIAGAAGCTVEQLRPEGALLTAEEESELILDCLQTVPQERIAGFLGPVDRYSAIPASAFLMWEKGLVHDVPTIIGTNELEGWLFVDLYSEPFGIEGELTDNEFMFLLKLGLPKEHQQFALDLYDDIRRSEGNRMALSHALGDVLFCDWTATTNGTKFMSSPMYVYVFTEPNFVDGHPATHFSEVPYVFGWIPPRAEERSHFVERHVVQWWTSFAAAGNPNTLAAHDALEWPAYNPDEQNTIMMINAQEELVTNFNAFYCEAWMEELDP